MSTTKPLNAYSQGRVTRRLKDFAASLKTALDSALPSVHKPYGQVAVIAFHWSNDDMNVARLETELLTAFSRIYNFHTESYVIPDTMSQITLGMKLSQWSLRWAQLDALRIYVYSGHAGSAAPTAFRWFIALVVTRSYTDPFCKQFWLTNYRGKVDANGNLNGPMVDWWAIRASIEDCPGDMCYIFDCCSAGSVAMHDGPETMAAVGWNQLAGANPHFSYTQVLIDRLRDLNGMPETLAGIYSRIFQNVAHNQIHALPVHIPKKGSRSLTLRRLPEGSSG
jgi:hypothetical protein